MIDFREKYKAGLGLQLSPYDSRDYHFGAMFPGINVVIPDNYETPDADFTYDQGQSMMCCSCAYTALRYLQERDQSGVTERFAPCFTYADRDPDEIYEGMDIRSCVKHGNKSGVVLWEELPYFGSLDQMMKDVDQKRDELYLKAAPFSTNSYYSCNSRREVQIGIMNCKGVIIGIPVYSNFYRPGVDGRIEYIKGLTNDGGHAILLYGWKLIDGNFYWKVKNSWGHEWGINGSCYLSEKYPWMCMGWTVIDNKMDMNYAEYRNKFYPVV